VVLRPEVPAEATVPRRRRRKRRKKRKRRKLLWVILWEEMTMDGNLLRCNVTDATSLSLFALI